MSNKGEKTGGGIGAFDFFCIGFGAIVGVGWAVSINNWMAGSGGPIPASIGYIIALIMMVPVALCYCELAPMMPVAGGGTAYAYRAFGEKIAFISGWAAFGGFVAIIPWEAIYVCDILSILFPFVKGPLLYVSYGSPVHLGHIILGTFFSFVLFFVNWKGATTSALMQRILTVILVGSGIIGAIVALTKFNTANFQPYFENVGSGSATNFFGGAIAILASAPFFLAGFETIPQAVEDAEGDITSVGKTVVMAVGLACIFYAFLLFCFGSAMPWKEFVNVKDASGEIISAGMANPAAANMFLHVYPNALGQVMYYLILIGAICGLFTTWNGFMMASPRLLMGMARGYMMPRALIKQNANGTPTNGLICCLALSLVGPFAGVGLINDLTSFSAAGFVTSWAITSFCVVRLRAKEPNAERPYKIPGGSATAWFAGILMTIVWLLLFVKMAWNPVYMGDIAVIMFIIWMAIGFVLYLVAGKDRNKVSVEERTRSLFERRGA